MFEIIDTDNERTYRFKDDFERSQFYRFEQDINDFYMNDERNLVLDFENIYSLDSHSLSVLLRIKKNFNSKDRDVEIINYNEQILRLFNMSGLGDFIFK